MIVLQHTVISDDIKDKFFVCNLEKCKGACCVEGDLGAPLEEEELKYLEDNYEAIKPYLTGAGKKAIEEQGLYMKCGIEQAYLDGKISWRKPISCHLYPIRITKYDAIEALNYDKWSICANACTFGAELGVRVYQFLKEPLIRKYGAEWYQELTEMIEQPELAEKK